jgi:hypothetical protein
MKSRRKRCAEHEHTCERSANNILVVKPAEETRFGRPGYTREDNAKTDVTETECDDMDWINLIQDKDKDGLL